MSDAAGQPADELHLLHLQHLLFEPGALRDVQGCGHQGGSSLVLHPPAVDLQTDEPSVLVAYPRRIANLVHTVDKPRLHRVLGCFLVLVHHQITHGHRKQLVTRVPGELRHLRIDEDEAPSLHDADADKRLVDQPANERLCLVERRRRRPLLGDVLDCADDPQSTALTAQGDAFGSDGAHGAVRTHNPKLDRLLPPRVQRGSGRQHPGSILRMNQICEGFEPARACTRRDSEDAVHLIRPPRPPGVGPVFIAPDTADFLGQPEKLF